MSFIFPKAIMNFSLSLALFFYLFFLFWLCFLLLAFAVSGKQVQLHRKMQLCYTQRRCILRAGANWKGARPIMLNSS